MSFSKSIGKSIGKNISKSLSSKYNQKLLDHAKNSTTDALKTTSTKSSKNIIQKFHHSIIQKTAEATSDLIGNKIADRITKVSKTWPQNNSERITKEQDKEILKERYISPEERHEIIDELRLIQ